MTRDRLPIDVALYLILLGLLGVAIVVWIQYLTTYELPEWYYFIVFILVVGSFTRITFVPEDMRYVFERLRKFAGVACPGLRVSLRLFEEVRPKIDDLPGGKRYTRQFVLQFKVKETVTKDGIVIPLIVGDLIHKLIDTPEGIYNNTYVPGQGVPRTLQILSENSIRMVVGSKNLREFTGSAVDADVLAKEAPFNMVPTMQSYGEEFIGIKITENFLPEDYAKLLQGPAIAELAGESRRIGAEKDKATAALAADAAQETARGQSNARAIAAEGEKQETIKRAEGLKQKEILESESKSQVLKNLKKALTGKEELARLAIDFTMAEEIVAAAQAIGSSPSTKYVGSGLLSEVRSMLGQVTSLIGSQDSKSSK